MNQRAFLKRFSSVLKKYLKADKQRVLLNHAIGKYVEVNLKLKIKLMVLNVLCEYNLLKVLVQTGYKFLYGCDFEFVFLDCIPRFYTK